MGMVRSPARGCGTQIEAPGNRDMEKTSAESSLTMERASLRLPLCLAIFLLSIRPALADGCALSVAPRYQLRSDAVEWKFQIVSGRSCFRGLRYAAVTIDTVKLISPPQHGRVTLVGTGFSYIASSDFAGQDAFALQISGSMVRSRGTSDIKVIISVGEN
jgi:hypothetical protein